MAASITSSKLASLPYLTLHTLNPISEETLPHKNTNPQKKGKWFSERAAQLEEQMQTSGRSPTSGAQSVIFPHDSKRAGILNKYIVEIAKELKKTPKLKEEIVFFNKFLKQNKRSTNPKITGPINAIHPLYKEVIELQKNAKAELEVQMELFAEELKAYKAKGTQGEEAFVASQIKNLNNSNSNVRRLGPKKALEKRITACYLQVLGNNLTQIQERAAADPAAKRGTAAKKKLDKDAPKTDNPSSSVVSDTAVNAHPKIKVGTQSKGGPGLVASGQGFSSRTNDKKAPPPGGFSPFVKGLALIGFVMITAGLGKKFLPNALQKKIKDSGVFQEGSKKINEIGQKIGKWNVRERLNLSSFRQSFVHYGTRFKETIRNFV